MAATKTKSKQKKERVNRAYSEAQKVKIVSCYLKTSKSLSEIGEKFDIYPQMIVRWKNAMKNHPKLKGLKKIKKSAKKRAKGGKKA